VIVIYAQPSADGTGFVIHKCYRCYRRHFLDGLGTRWLRCGQVVQIRSTEERQRPNRRP
jgi:hypothetical protein